MKQLLLTILCAIIFPMYAYSDTTPQQIGVAAAVNGKTILYSSSIKPEKQPVGAVLKSGEKIFLNDRITTDPNGKLQIMLLDETIFTLGPNSDMVMDEFVYDPKTNAGKVTAKITKGIFRFVTGKVARKEPENMKVKLAVGTIGIRGTTVVGQTGPNGSTVILTGPGVNNNANENPGAIVITGNNENNPTLIDTPGYGSNINSGGGVSNPEDMTDRMTELNNSLNQNPNGQNNSSQNNTSENNNADNDESPSVNNNQQQDENNQQNSAEEQSGQQYQNTLTNIDHNENTQDNSNDLLNLTTEDNQQNQQNNEIQNMITPLTFGEFRNLASLAKATYNTYGAITNASNTKSYNLEINSILNFDTRQFDNLDFTVSKDDTNYIKASGIDIQLDNEQSAEEEVTKELTQNDFANNLTYYDTQDGNPFDGQDFSLLMALNESPNAIYPAIATLATFNTIDDDPVTGDFTSSGEAYRAPMNYIEFQNINLPVANYSVDGTILNTNAEDFNFSFTTDVNFADKTFQSIILTVSQNNATTVEAAYDGNGIDISKTEDLESAFIPHIIVNPEDPDWTRTDGEGSPYENGVIDLSFEFYDTGSYPTASLTASITNTNNNEDYLYGEYVLNIEPLDSQTPNMEGVMSLDDWNNFLNDMAAANVGGSYNTNTEFTTGVATNINGDLLLTSDKAEINFSERIFSEYFRVQINEGEYYGFKVYTEDTPNDPNFASFDLYNSGISQSQYALDTGTATSQVERNFDIEGSVFFTTEGMNEGYLPQADISMTITDPEEQIPTIDAAIVHESSLPFAD